MMAALSTAVFAGINFTVTIRGVLVVMVAVSAADESGNLAIRSSNVAIALE